MEKYTGVPEKMPFKGERDGMEKDNRLKVFSLQSCLFKLLFFLFSPVSFCLHMLIHLQPMHITCEFLRSTVSPLNVLLQQFLCYYKIFITIIFNCRCNTLLYKDTYFITVFSFYWALEIFTFLITISNSFIIILCISI